MPQIEVRGLTKLYDNNIIANNDISFSIEKGEVIGLLGKNGAGKTTLLSLLGKEFLPSKGKILIDGNSLQDSDSDKICVVHQELGLFDFLTVDDHLRYFSILRSTRSKQISNQAIQKTIKSLKIESLLKRKAITLSEGEKRRVMLAMAIMTNSEILVLDEPTANLDNEWKNYIIDFLYLINKEQSKTIIYTSHNLEEVAKITSKVLILDSGKLLYFDKIQSILSDLKYTQKIVVKNNADVDIKLIYLCNERKSVFMIKGNIDSSIYFNTQDITFISNFLTDNRILFNYQSIGLDDFFRLNIE